MILKYTVVSVIGMVSLVVASLFLVGMLWVADREEPAVVEKVWIEPQVVKICGTFDVHVKRYKTKASGVRVERTLVDSARERVILPKTELDENPGPYGDYDYNVSYNVPCTFSPGWAEYTARTQYFRNPLQEYVWPIEGGRWAIRICVTDDVQSSEQVCKTPHSPQ